MPIVHMLTGLLGLKQMESACHTVWCLLQVRSPTANITKTLPPESFSCK